MSGGWLADDTSALAVERILDAAGRCFARDGVAATGMAEVAAEAGCSRATLYRYVPNRRALHVAFVDREAARLADTVAAEVAAVDDPAERVVEAVVAAVAAVRADATLAAWFVAGDAARAADLARSSAVIDAVAVGLVGDVDRARWVVRVILSLLAVPGDDPADERTLLERYLAPVVT